jgi:hypothetical protein
VMSTPPPEQTQIESTESSSNPIFDLVFFYLNQVLSLCAQFLGIKPSQPQQPEGVQAESFQTPEFLLLIIEWFAFDDFQVNVFISNETMLVAVALY